MDQVPAEVLVNICESLPRVDLKNLRFVSRGLQAASEPALFRTIYLSYNLRSFERFQDIAEHQRFRRHVRTIDYDVRSFGTVKSGVPFRDWVQNWPGRGMGLIDRHTFMRQFTDIQLESYYMAWNVWIFGEAFLHRRDNAKNMLATTLPKLTGLTGIRCGAIKMCYGAYYQVPSIESMSMTAQQILCEPQHEHGFYQAQFHSLDLFKLACDSGYVPNLSELSLSCITLKSWDNQAASFMNEYENLPALKTLSLELSTHQSSVNHTFNLAKMITRCRALQTLRLSFTTVEIHLSSLINKVQYWEHLTELSLHAIETTEDHLRHILLRHANTLRSFELSNTTFTDPSVENQPCGSFVDFFQFLNQCMTLEYAEFEGYLSNNWDEAWVAASQKGSISEPQPELFSDCLKYQVERFVTRNGPFPFVPSENADPICGIWDQNGDSSWNFAPHKLM